MHLLLIAISFLLLAFCANRFFYHHKWNGTCCLCGKGTNTKIAKCPIYGGHEYYYYHDFCLKDAFDNYDTYSSRDVDMALKIKGEILGLEKQRQEWLERVKKEVTEGE